MAIYWKRLLVVLGLVCVLSSAALADKWIELSYDSGNTVYATIYRKADDKVWDVANTQFDTWADGDIDDNDLALTDKGSDWYKVAFPTSITAGEYTINVYVQAGGSPAISDPLAGAVSVLWDGRRFR